MRRLLLSLVLLLSGCSAGSASVLSTPAEVLLWHDEFNGPVGSAPDPAMWTPELGGSGWGNNEQESYTSRPDNLSVNGKGSLQLTARRETYTGADHIARPWTSARITTFGKRSLLYGRLSVRMRVPAGDGLWPAAWTMGTNIQQVGWPACGEIDVVETTGAAKEALQTLHGPKTGRSDDWYLTQRTPAAGLPAAFHTYTVDWKPKQVTFSIDGRTTRVLTPSSLPPGTTWPFNQAQYVLLDLAVGGNLPGPPTAKTPAAASLLVDWVRVYKTA